MEIKIRKKDRVPFIIFVVFTLLFILSAILFKSKKVFLGVTIAYLVISNIIIAKNKWLRPENIILNFAILFFCWLFTWLFLKNIIGYVFMKWLLIFNYVLYILNAILVIYSFIKRKRRMLVHYVSLIWFIITTMLVSYLIYIYVFSFIFMLSF